MLPPLTEPASSRIFTRDMSPRQATQIFRRQSDLIRQGWSRRKAQANRRTTRANAFTEAPDDWMIRCTYRLIRSMIDRGHTSVLDAEIVRLGIGEQGPHSIADQPFKKALALMFGSTRPGGELMTRNRRMWLGNAMAYAAAHVVPSKYVNGFVKQAGLKASGPKLAANYREPGFE